MNAPESRSNVLTRWKPGQSGNPKGTTSAGSLIKHHLNAFGDMGLGEEEIRAIARDKSLPWTRRAAAERALRTLEAGDMADFEEFLDGTPLKTLRKQGLNTEVVKKVKQKTRIIPQKDGDPVTEVDREIELHDRAGVDFDRVMDRTEGKPRQEIVASVHSVTSFVFYTPGQAEPVGRLSLPPVDVEACQTPAHATFTQSGEKTAQLEAAGGVAESPVDLQPIENAHPMTLGKSYIPLLDGTLQDQFVLCESQRGAGKTRAILTIMMARAMRHPGSRWLVVRSSRTRLTDSAIATFVDQVLPLFGLPVPACSREQISTYTLPADKGGAQFIFQGLDDPNRQQSVECAGVYVVEGVEIGSLEIITALAASMRQVCEPPLPFFQCIVDCNPGAPGHPLNKVAEPASDDLRIVETREQYEKALAHNARPAMPGKWKRIICHHFDNPGYFDTVKWAWTKVGEQYLKTLSFLTGFLKKRWLYGLWAAAEGSVFGNVFEPEIHIIDDFEPPADWALYVGWDPGIDHVTGMPWVSVAPNGDYFVLEEVYEGGKSIAAHVQTNVMPRLVGRIVRNWLGDPHHFFSITAQSPKSCAQQAKEAGLSYAYPWADLRGPAKQAAVNALLEILQNTARVVKGGERVGPCLFVMRRCVNTIAEFQSWSYRRNAKGEQLAGDDAYEDKNNHLVGDPLVGMIASRMLKYEDTGSVKAAANGD